MLTELVIRQLKLLKDLGAKVISIGVKPNGLNINENCGSTHPYKIKTAVKKYKAHVGISFDGDADRIIMCDEKGQSLLETKLLRC